jgi:hypothetical protein
MSEIDANSAGSDYAADEQLEQLQYSDTLEQGGPDDPLDAGYSPPDSARGSRAFGTTAYEQSLEETIDQRILQEEPDPHSAYGAPENESGLDTERVGGDDPDAIDAEEDWLGDGEVGARRAGRLVAPDQGVSDDLEPELVGLDVGIDGAAASAEEAAVHVVEDPDWE